MLFGKYVNNFYKKYLFFFLFGVVALIVVDYVQLLIPENFGMIVDEIKDGTILSDQSILLRHITIIAVSAIIIFFGRFTWRYTLFGVSVRIETDLRDLMFIHNEKLSYSYYKQHKTGALMALYTNDIQAIKAYFGDGIIMIVDFLFLGSMTLYKMFKLNVMLTLICLIPAIVIGVASVFISKKLEEKFAVRQKSYEKLSDFTQENFSGISVIKAFNKEKQELKEFNNINQENYDKNIGFLRYYMILNSALILIISLITGIIFSVGAYLIINDDSKFSVGNLNTYSLYFSTLVWPIMAVANYISLHSQAGASLRRITELLDEEVDIKDDNVVDNDINGKIVFKNLSFKYPDGDDYVLNNMSFTINKGEFVGILGKTGSGKSTIVDLLVRLYNVSCDSIYLDDTDIMNLPFKKVRENIGYVPQENFLFSDTIDNNIAFSDKNVDQDKVINSAILADVDANIKDFSEGYQTVLGERGVSLSGGQKQRVSIARALYKNPPVLIFDDSVSAVDTKTETKILKNLREFRKDKTTIMISHRISTVKNLDKIILIDEGKVVDVGSHEELYKRCSLYQEMVNLQTLEEEVNSDGK